MKSQSITKLRAIYRHDIECYVMGAFDEMLMAKDVPGAGLCWPIDWLSKATSEVNDKWIKFMNGQAFCSEGFYERDVRRFLFDVMK